MLGKFTRKHQTDCGLDFTTTQGGLLIVSGKLTGLGGNTLKDIINEGVHDRHGFLRNTGIRVYLLQYLVDVGGVRLNALFVLLAARCCLLGGFGRLLGRSLRHGF